MERQHAVVKFLSHLGQVWVYASHKPELLTTSMMVSDRTPLCKVRAGFVHLLNTSGSFGWPVWTTYKQFGAVCICHIGYVTRSTNVNLSSLTNGNIPNMTDANLTKLFVKWLHMGHPKQSFALKRCTNPALTLHTGVLSKSFAIKSH